MVSLDTRKWKEKLQSSSSMVASVLVPSICGQVYTTHNHKNAVQTSRVRDCDGVISRWSPFGTC